MTHKTAFAYMQDIKSQIITLEIARIGIEGAGASEELLSVVRTQIAQKQDVLDKFEKLELELAKIQNKIRKLMIEEISEESKELMRSYQLEESFFGSYLTFL